MLMKNTLLAAGSLVRMLFVAGFFFALSTPAAIAVAQDQDMAVPPVKAAEVTPVTKENLAHSDTQPAFQGLVPATTPATTSATHNGKQGIAGDIVTYGMETVSGNDTHPALRITPDKSALVRLDRDASSIIVGNPDHLGVLMDNRRLLILVPRQAGATYMTVLDSTGAVIMQRHVIIASPQDDYIRIRRSCAGQGRDCQETSVYYCPGMCHPVGTVTTQGSGELAPLVGPSAYGSDDSNFDAPPPAPVIPVTSGQ